MGEVNWIFRFSYVEEDPGENTVSRSQLEKPAVAVHDLGKDRKHPEGKGL